MNCSIARGNLFSALLLTIPLTTHAGQPGVGLTARFEVRFMKEAIDHHYAALRMTELAAGTDPTRDPQISSEEGTSPTPDTAATEAKATLDVIKSLARRNNRNRAGDALRALTAGQVVGRV